MLLGKRPRPPIKRTTSMTGITVDPSMLEPQDPSDHHHHHPMITDSSSSSLQPPADQTMNMNMNMNMMNFAPNPNGYEYEYDNRFVAMVSPRGTISHRTRSNPGEFMNDPHFLHTCGLCKRRLPPGRDIYMYRGDTAFCSLECREQQIKQDERKEKCRTSVASKKEGSSSTASTKASSKSETVAAA